MDTVATSATTDDSSSSSASTCKFSVDVDLYDIPPSSTSVYAEIPLVRVAPALEIAPDKLAVLPNPAALPPPSATATAAAVAFVEPSVLLCAAANHAVVLDLVAPSNLSSSPNSHSKPASARRLLNGPRCGGLTAVAVHPARTHVAIAESHAAGPNIYIFSYPAMALERVLRHGASKEYAHVAFAPDPAATLLLSVSGGPDHLICIWDWRCECLLLHSTAGTTDVFAAAFFPHSDTALVTAGVAHIKFWSIADTFTGLKLQATPGRFGAHELADIPCFVFLPTLLSSPSPSPSHQTALIVSNQQTRTSLIATKKSPSTPVPTRILAATDCGPLLLWKDGFIELALPVASPVCSMFLAIDLPDSLVCGCRDGLIRIYNVAAIMVSELSPNCSSALVLLSTLALPGKHPILCILPFPHPLSPIYSSGDLPALDAPADTPDRGCTLVINATGHMLRANVSTASCKTLLSFHAGPIADTASAPRSHLIATLGRNDCSLRIQDAVSSLLLSSLTLPAGGSCLRYLPLLLDPFGSSLVAAFTDGSVRFFQHSSGPVPDASLVSISSNFSVCVTHAFRLFKEPIVALEFGSLASTLLAATASGSIFVFVFPLRLQTKSLALDIADEDLSHFDRKTLIVPLGIISLPNPITYISSRPCLSPPTSSEIPGIVFEKFAIAVAGAGGTDWLLLLTLDFLYENKNQTDYAIPASFYILEKWAILDYPCPKLNQGNPKKTNDDGGEDAQKFALADLKLSNPIRILNLQFPIFLSEELLAVCLTRSDGVIEIRVCKLSAPESSMLLFGVSTTVISFAASRQSVNVGCINGTVYFTPTMFEMFSAWPLEHSLVPVKTNSAYWKAALHRGPVRAVGATFDSALIYSCGEDGALMVCRNKCKKLCESIFSDSLFAVLEGEDLTTNYTVQERELMTKLDAEKLAAVARKLDSLAKIAVLRTEFNHLLEENKSLPDHVRVPLQEFEIDPGLEERHARDVGAQIARVKLETQWESEKISILLRNLRKKYCDPVANEVFSVCSFMKKTVLFSFRTQQLGLPQLKCCPEQSARPISSPLVSEGTNQLITRKGSANTEQESIKNPRFASTIGGKAAVDPGAIETRTKQDVLHVGAASRLKERRRVWAERKEELRKLLAAKPSINSEDPRDVAAIEFAEKNTGDYKLKMDKDYVVPESQVVNAESKTKHLIMLQESLENIMEAFNLRARELQECRAALDSRVNQRNQLARDLIRRLARLGLLVRAELVSEILFENQLGIKRQQEIDSKSDFDDAELTIVKEEGDGAPKPTDYQISEDSWHVRALFFELLATVEESKADIDNFDCAFEVCLHERTKIAIDIKQGELRMLLLHQECGLLKEFEKNDAQLTENLCMKIAEKSEIEKLLYELQSKMNGKRTEVEHEMSKKKALGVQMQRIIGENIRHKDLLVNLYCQNVTRKQRHCSEFRGIKRNGAVGGVIGLTTALSNVTFSNAEDFDNEKSPARSHNGMLDAEESDDGVSAAVAFPASAGGLPAAAYAAVLALRDQRLCVDWHLAVCQRTIDCLKKDYGGLLKREKNISSALRHSRNEMQQFQNQKQQKLNEIYTAIPLSLNQVQCSTNAEGELEGALVFPKDGIEHLEKRITQIKEETEQVRSDHRQLKLEHLSLLSSRRSKKELLGEAEKKLAEVQMLKFGRRVDIEKLERIGESKQSEELLLQQFRDREIKYGNELAGMHCRIEELKGHYRDAVRENTERLEELHDLGVQKRKMEATLESNQRNVLLQGGASKSCDNAARERADLEAKLDAGATLIEELTRQLRMFDRK